MGTGIGQGLEPELAALAVKFLRAYLECSDELQECAREMIAIADSEESDADERNMAIDTLAEILFPQHPRASVALEELDVLSAENQSDGRAALQAFFIAIQVLKSIAPSILAEQISSELSFTITNDIGLLSGSLAASSIMN